MARNDDRLPPFFTQHGLLDADWQMCLRFIKDHYPGYVVDGDVHQGGCSYTVRVKKLPTAEDVAPQSTLIIQFRPARYALSTDVILSARVWYGHLAPWMEEAGRLVGGSGVALVVYCSSYVGGERFDSVKPRQRTSLSPDVTLKYHNLLDDLANSYATAWTQGRSRERRSCPNSCNGKVGSSIAWRLRRLEMDLPTKASRSIAVKARTEMDIGLLNRLPIVFTHGDLLPSNILVDEQSWHINGLIDWAESEYLPFGMSLYGLEHLLGNLSGENSKSKFEYLDDAASLRLYFWRQLSCRVPELKSRRLCEAVQLARIVGVLLWFGFAWDDGKIDRVVDPARDAEEIACLEAFLDVNARQSGPRL